MRRALSQVFQRAFSLEDFASLSVGLAALACVVACGGQAPTPKADLMAETTVGKNRCQSGKDVERPFIIEWDATDFASFESKAGRDLVFVKIDGCNLKVLDCRDDGIPGKYGSYDAPQWTSGAVEGFEIKNEGDLYAKLPFGATSLSGSVKGGNELQLKYFVSGSRPALRSLVYKGDVAQNPLCASATHFVAGYDLGAFDLTTKGHSSASAEVAVTPAAGGGGNLSHSESHLRQAGSLADCTKETAKELARCRVPIRLALRPLQEGANPAQPPSSANAAMPAGFSEEWSLLVQSSGKKMQLRDGKGCLADLDRAEAIKKSPIANLDSTRAFCEMLVGRCDDGRRRYRAWLQSTAPAMSPEQLDSTTTTYATQYCEGKERTPAERANKAHTEVIDALHKQDVARCTEHGKTLLETFPKLDATEQRSVVNAPHYAADCLAKHGGDCTLAKQLQELYVNSLYATSSPDQRAAHIASYKCPSGTTAKPAPPSSSAPAAEPKKKPAKKKKP